MIRPENITCGQCIKFEKDSNGCKAKTQTGIEYTTENTPVIVARLRALKTSAPTPIKDALELVTCFSNPETGTQLVYKIHGIYVNRPVDNIVTLPIASPKSA